MIERPDYKVIYVGSGNLVVMSLTEWNHHWKNIEHLTYKLKQLEPIKPCEHSNITTHNNNFGECADCGIEMQRKGWVPRPKITMESFDD